MPYEQTPPIEGMRFTRKRLSFRNWCRMVWAKIVGRLHYWWVTRDE